MIKKTCQELKYELESLNSYDFYVDVVYRKDGSANGCVIFSGRKNKDLDFVYCSYDEHHDCYFPELEDVMEDIEIYEVPEKEILKHYYKLKEILEK